MGKLYSSKTYLIGAMDRVSDGGVEWREWITPHLHKLGSMVFNPCSKPIDDPRLLETEHNREERKFWKSTGQFEKVAEGKPIRNTDLRMVDLSDYIIANIDVDIHACGTYEELSWANRSKKPVLVHCNQGKDKAPDWLFWMLPHIHIFNNWNELLGHLDYINKEGNDDSGRWILFDMYKELECIRRYRYYGYK